MTTDEPDFDKLLATTDASIWAGEFLALVDKGVSIDEELMIDWFANAIVTGRAAGLDDAPSDPATWTAGAHQEWSARGLDLYRTECVAHFYDARLCDVVADMMREKWDGQTATTDGRSALQLPPLAEA